MDWLITKLKGQVSQETVSGKISSTGIPGIDMSKVKIHTRLVHKNGAPELNFLFAFKLDFFLCDERSRRSYVLSQYNY